MALFFDDSKREDFQEGALFLPFHKNTGRGPYKHQFSAKKKLFGGGAYRGRPQKKAPLFSDNIRGGATVLKTRHKRKLMIVQPWTFVLQPGTEPVPVGRPKITKNRKNKKLKMNFNFSKSTNFLKILKKKGYQKYFRKK